MNPTTVTNTNPLQLNNFKVVVSRERTNLEFFIVTAPIPGLSLNETAVDVGGHTAYFPGDTLVYEPLNLTVFSDEDLNAYTEVLNWIVANWDTNNKATKYDLSVLIYDSNKVHKHTFVFANAFPTDMTEIVMSVQDNDVTYSTFGVTFRYDRFVKLPA